MSTGYLILEVRRAMRSTRFMIFTLAMPVFLFLLYVGIFTKPEDNLTGVLMVNMTCYGALSAALFALVYAPTFLRKGMALSRKHKEAA